LATVTMSNLRILLLAGIAAVVATGCGGPTTDAARVATSAGSTGSSEVISGEDALRLYGITSEPKLEPTPTVLDPSWFPREVWVSASVLPYDDGAPIRILPVYSDAGLDVTGTWLGDLEAGEKAFLKGVDQAGRSCFVSGQAAQGWDLEGWVACNRILLSKPTALP
jgi:hypothetical protein